ncbi:helix-turn-helix domain-containing protein [Oryzifoliimicrobium ureilyticus]|uniref:helix-turn-helix domain-containing protein n=1 Tax=Oryzifoliimicrobium ureilyticus TaxID=3113724 RepID=UPI0030764DDA
MSYDKIAFGEICFEWHALQGKLEFSLHPKPETTIFLFCHLGNLTRQISKTEYEYFSIAALSNERAEILRVEDRCEYVSVSIPNALFRERLATLMDRPPGRHIEFTKVPDSDLESLRLLRDQLQVLPTMPIMKMKSLLGCSKASLRNLVVDCFLLLFPNNYLATLEDTPTIAPRHVKRALGHIHDNPWRNIAPQALADLSSVSKRTLQYAFQSVTGQTISEYQRLLRLSGAHEMVTTNLDVPLKSIAQMWGFGSYAAFGQSYKKTYGISPAQARHDVQLSTKAGAQLQKD